jgi:hypothetical protein
MALMIVATTVMTLMANSSSKSSEGCYGGYCPNDKFCSGFHDESSL